MITPQNREGFTLVEFLVVLAIIAALIAIAIPTFTASRDRAELAAEQANASSLHTDCIAKLLSDEIDPAIPQEINAGGKTYIWHYNETDGEARPYVVVAETENLYPFDIGYGLYAPLRLE